MAKRTARDAAPAKALRLSRQLLRHLPSGIVFFNSGGRVEDANPSARAALGFAHPRGLSLTELFRDAELRDADGALLGPAADLMAEAAAAGRILQRKTLRYTTPTGLGRYLGVTLFPGLETERGAPSGMICLLTDLTAIRALEEELQRRKNLSALGEMAAGIAHEFKNALATISGYAQMLSASLSGVERERARKILVQTAMLSNVATEFLNFARPLEVQPVALDLGALLRQCIDALPAQDFPQVQFELEGPFPTVAGDGFLLTAAVMNLLRNSCEAILLGGRGSHVHLRCAGTVATVPQATRPRPAARLLVVDDGPGIRPEIAEKIFIPFFTTKPDGTGLGLAMVHKIVIAHQGSVLLADAAPGHTVFELLLPLPEEPPALARRPRAGQPAPKRTAP